MTTNRFKTRALKTSILSVLIFGLACTGLGFGQPGASFSDVTPSYWAGPQILILANHDIVNGLRPGEFVPTGSVTRGQLAKLLTKAFVLPQSPTGSFKDVSSSLWSFPYIGAVTAKTWMNGFADGTFRPEGLTTRAEMAKVLVSAREFEATATAQPSFKDVTASHWAFPYVEAAASAGLLFGYEDGTFRPNKNLTRAEAAALIYRALVKQDITVERQTAGGVTYERHRRFRSQGPLSINFLRIPRLASLETTFTLAKDKVIGRETLTSMATRKSAIAGLNGDYFSKNGDPSGLMVKSDMISHPLSNRSFFGIYPGGGYFIDRASLSANVYAVNGKSYPVSAVNQARDISGYSNRLVIYAPSFNLTTLTDTSGVEIVVQTSYPLIPGAAIPGTVTRISDRSGNLTIPYNGVVISATGSARYFLLQNFRVGDVLTLDVGLTSSLWQFGSGAIGGGPRVLRNSLLSVENEGFGSETTGRRDPQAAVGILPDGGLVLLEVDGRKQYFSVGMTLQELGTELKDLGATDGMAMDSGGSSTLFFNGRIRNYPSDGRERAIANAILILPR